MADVLVLMGSQSDAATMKHCIDLLTKLGVSFEDYLASAHRTPKRTDEFAATAARKGFKVIIAAAGMAAALPGAVVAHNLTLPTFGVAIEGRGDVDNLAAILAMVDLPPGVPVGLAGLGKAGAINAALLAAAVVGLSKPFVRQALEEYRTEQTKSVAERPDYSAQAKS